MPATNTLRAPTQPGSKTAAEQAVLRYQIELTLKGAEESTQTLYFGDQADQRHTAEKLRDALVGDVGIIDTTDALGTIMLRAQDIVAIRTIDRTAWRTQVQRESLTYLNLAAASRRNGELLAESRGASWRGDNGEDWYDAERRPQV